MPNASHFFTVMAPSPASLFGGGALITADALPEEWETR